MLRILAFLFLAFPAAAQPPPAQRAALAAMERLRADIVTLDGLAAAQEALLARNRGLERAEALPGEICRDLGDWCRLLPATFGAGR